MPKKPNVPMTAPISTCRQNVDKKKYEDGWDRIWGKKDTFLDDMADSSGLSREHVHEFAKNVHKCSKMKKDKS